MTVRNWIKTGYLEQVSKDTVSGASITQFWETVAGQEKLTARANKSLKDAHNHNALQTDFLNYIQTLEHSTTDLGTQYEQLLSNAYRNREGIYYTPNDITEQFFQFLPTDLTQKTFCDPCCGSGNFILTALKHGIAPDHIYGFDTDPVAVAITKKRILDETGADDAHIVCADFLQTSLNQDKKYFDIILTNPPWGQKLTVKKRNTYGQALGCGKSVDTSALFFFASLKSLAHKGHLGFLLPEAFFNIGAFEDARQAALFQTIKALIDFGKPFPTLMTKAKGIVLQNLPAHPATRIPCLSNNQTTLRPHASFATNPKSIFNLSCTHEDTEVIAHILKQPHITLHKRARFGLGIVTGNNKKHCRSRLLKNHMPIYTGTDIHKTHLTPPTRFIPKDLSLYHQVAPKDLFEAPEKLMYKFISSHLVFYHDTDQSYCLNSANILVLKNDFPITTQQLGCLLNSDVLNWLFHKLFETHKVLRSDLEALPIHTQYFATHSTFAEETFLSYLGIERTHAGFRICR